MSSLVSTGSQEIVNLVTTADVCVHTDDTTQQSPTSCEFVFTLPTPTRQNSFVSSASAVCIGHYRATRTSSWIWGGKRGDGIEEKGREGRMGDEAQTRRERTGMSWGFGLD